MIPAESCLTCKGTGFSIIEKGGLTGASKCFCWHYPNELEQAKAAQLGAGVAQRFLPLPPQEIVANHEFILETDRTLTAHVADKKLKLEPGYEAPDLHRFRRTDCK
jgi:hypothetical protein